MTEENNELTLLLKELVDRVKQLEYTVFSADNVLMKSGLVVTNSPTPSINTNTNGVPNADTLAKMEWTEVDDLVRKLTGDIWWV